jgi:tetratricopeptide (TPR) repeat protein
VYNSLAWEFALKKKYPEETLEAAKRAHELAPEEAHIIDTLAEAYYAAGDYESAVMWEEKALELEPENEFYIQQLDKFKKAREKK